MSSDQEHQVSQHQSFVEFLYKHTAKFAERKAIIDFDSERRVTFAELKQQVEAVASALVKRGFGRGQYLSMCSSNCLENAPIAHGTMATGGTLHLVKPGASREELLIHSQMIRPRFVVTSSDRLSFVRSTIEEADCGVEEIFVIGDTSDGCRSAKELLDDDGTENPIGKVTIDPENDVALMLATGGTTGISKCVMGTHKTLILGVTKPTKLESAAEQYMISFSPFNYIGGILSAYGYMLYSGVTVVSMEGFESEKILKGVEKYQTSMLLLAPATASALVRSEHFQQVDIKCLKYMMYGGAPMPESTAKEIMEKFEEKSPGIIFLQGYGMTEIFGGAIATGFTTAQRSTKLGSAGKAVPYVEVKIRSLKNDRSFCNAGEPGELIIKSPMLMKGYFNNEEATKRAIKDGWYYTGDYGWFDEDEYYYIVDRIDQLLHTKDGMIVPSELESLIQSHPNVGDCVVVGKKEGGWDEPVAFVAANGAVTEDEIKSFVADKVEPFQQLKSVRFTEEIPRSPAGKLLRRKMKV